MLSCSPRQLQRRFDEALLPPPQRLVTLSRWLPVVDLLAIANESVRDLARALGFDAPRELYRAATREVHVSIPEMRRGGVAPRLIAELGTGYQRARHLESNAAL